MASPIRQYNNKRSILPHSSALLVLKTIQHNVNTVQMASSEQAFVNSFWGLQDAGFAAIQLRIKTSQATLTELLHFYKERLAIEREYNRKLEKLSGSSKYGNGETGTLKIALDKFRLELDRMVQQHSKFVRSVSLHNYEKLHNFCQIYDRNIAKIETHMHKVLARKHDLKQTVSAAKEKYRLACAQEKTLSLQCQTTWGKELDNHTVKLNKVRLTLATLSQNYQLAVERYREIHEIWVRDWSIALLSIYSLEVERIQICKLNCFSFCNHVASLCVDWDQAVDTTRSSFANVAAPKDATDFVVTYGTGSQIPSPPEFVNFAGGCDDTSEDKYTVANFKDPDYTQILSRTFSTHSGMTATTGSARSPSTSPPKSQPAPVARTPSPQKTLPPIRKSLDLSPDTGIKSKPVLLPESHTTLLKQPSQYSNVTGDSNDIFDDKQHHASTHLSVYSHPSSYSNDTKRSWASPRRKLRQELQQEINRRLQDLSYMFPKSPEKDKEASKPVHITKDFSIDFIAKALDDLNAGGNGDVNKFRRSVRSTQQNSSPPRPASDFVDDSQEKATRKDSILFRAPETNFSKSYSGVDNGGSPQRRLPGLAQDLPVRTHRRSLLQSPTKSFKNLNSFVEGITPITKAHFVTKAVAKYGYKAREDGELAFKKGWHMYVIHKQEDNWYVCELGENCGSERGSVGLVPYNYVIEGDDVF
ncbi:hypothetical protein PUMCH_000535 [Australozyma saopauloensis]|uniref:F-BAR domain-containing protein n=1 Tax=Australozyma saopauloensis TaxID=291208 RepID=A0AAX4H475_9ASCO|nr:hypothetical protein PUMCH_000535 [[Candida] saopauloensis]